MRAFAILTTFLWLLTQGAAFAQECQPFDIELTTTPAPSQISMELARHKSQLDQPQSEVLLVGDSMIFRWPADISMSAFPGLSVANFGLPSDRLQNVIHWLPSIREVQPDPSTIVLWAGTNNLFGGDSVCAVLAGTTNLISETRALWPSARLVMIGIAPRGMMLAVNDENRMAVNTALRHDQIAGGYYFIDAGNELRCSMGKLSPTLQALHAEDRRHFQCRNYEWDLIHLSTAGYQLLSTAIALKF